ncbi:MAG: FAD-dependent monooxygenase [Gammaproteobacteria bacterium]|nr:FAD-dependent monooxygenase [Gammaproteobacteria bacterium]
MEIDYDVLVVGGGPVGATLACALADHGERVAVVEPADARDALPPGYDRRAYALALGSRRLLERAGAWPADARPTPIARIDIAQQHFPGRTRLDARTEGVAALGYVVVARDLGAALYARLGASAVAQLRPARVVAVTPARAGCRVTLDTPDGPRDVTARVAVAADGAGSATRSAAGLAAHEIDYGHSAVIAEVVPGSSHANTAYERFTPTGPLALLPAPASCRLVWTVPHDEAARLVDLDEAAFLNLLQRAFGDALGRFREARGRRAYPLHGLRVERLVRGRVVLAGNAAHTLHPIAGQGLNLGLRDVARLARLLDDALVHGEDPGDSRRLGCYAAERAAEHGRAFAFTDGLLGLFAGQALPWRAAKGLGLAGFNLAVPLRRRLADETMGLNGREGRPEATP